jgi:hypothetical protein
MGIDKPWWLAAKAIDGCAIWFQRHPIVHAQHQRCVDWQANVMISECVRAGLRTRVVICFAVRPSVRTRRTEIDQRRRGIHIHIQIHIQQTAPAPLLVSSPLISCSDPCGPTERVPVAPTVQLWERRSFIHSSSAGFGGGLITVREKARKRTD